ncbi:MAG: hypothetical protein IPP74_05050 [Alphaproteobacteria bacterium]|nr:hypothetical protein [Alphaproteobacteria bacterium]
MTQTSKSCTIKGDITVALTYNFEKNKATEVVVWDARLFSKDKISLKVNNHTYPYILVLFYSKDEHQIADDFEIANSAEIEVNPLSQEPINIYKIDLTGFKKLRHECQVYINDASINPNHKSQ